jgi:aspartate aminotransferase
MVQLRESIVSYYKRKTGIVYKPENVIVGPGSKELMMHLQWSLNAELLLPSPSWVSYQPQARILERETVWLETKREDGFILHAATIEAHCSKDPSKQRLLIINYPNNPTGSCMTPPQLAEVAAVCKKYNIVVLADEIYMDILHEGDDTPYFSIAQYYPEGTVLSTGLSKWAGAGGWRLGAFVFPESMKTLIRVMLSIASESFSCVSTPIQLAAITAFDGGAEIDSYLHGVRKVSNYITNAAWQKFTDGGVLVAAPKGGFYLFPDFEPFRNALAAKGVTNSKEFCQYGLFSRLQLMLSVSQNT